MPPQFKQNPPLGIIGVVIPLLIVIGLFYITYVRQASRFLQSVPNAPPGTYVILSLSKNNENARK